jgi:hypothetical protein
MIDIVMTATRRAEILAKTLKSFKKNLFGNNPARLIINIDPVGPDTDKVIADIAYCYFNNLLVFTPDTPSFPAAFKRVWSQAKAEFIVNLEDDWELLAPVDLADWVNIMNVFPDLALLRLPFKRQDYGYMKNWKYLFPWNGGFFNCPAVHKREVGFCGHPSLLRGDFVKAVAPFLDDTKNPEKQFHHGRSEIMAEIDKWNFGVYGRPNGPALIKDIGRDWMIKNNYQKAGNKALFTQWEKI